MKWIFPQVPWSDDRLIATMAKIFCDKQGVLDNHIYVHVGCKQDGTFTWRTGQEKYDPDKHGRVIGSYDRLQFMGRHNIKILRAETMTPDELSTAVTAACIRQRHITGLAEVI